MSVIENIRSEWMSARRGRERTKATLLGTLVGAVTNREKTFSPARALTEAEVIGEVKRMLDGVLETGRLLAERGGNEEQCEQNAVERAVLERFMPAQMSEAQIEAFAMEKKAEGMNMGAVMSALKNAYPGMYDGKVASGVVKRVLA